MKTPRVAFIWTRLPSYGLACLKNLRGSLGDNLFTGVFGDPPPHVNREEIYQLGEVHYYKYEHFNKDDYRKIINDVLAFNPDVLVVTGWHFKSLRKVARLFKERGVVTVSMVDTPWLGTLRQITKATLGSVLLKKCFSKIWVPGKSSRKLMRYAGYADEDIWPDLYCCDTNIFTHSVEPKEKYFVFVGRLEQEKNIQNLVLAFKRFNALNPEWRLYVIGDGSNKHFLKSIECIEHLGWKSSKDVASILHSSSGLVLPSTYEPWGVVVHEAASCGIPLLLSKSVHSRHEFLDHELNGVYFDPHNIDDLVTAFNFVSENNVSAMGLHSYQRAKRLTLETWARDFLTRLNDF